MSAEKQRPHWLSFNSGRMTEAGFEKIRKAKANGNWDNAYTALIPPELRQTWKKPLKRIPPLETISGTIAIVTNS